MTRLWRCVMAGALLLGLGTAVNPTAAAGAVVPVAGADDILSRLRTVPGLTVVEEREAPAPHRFFVLTYTQNINHRHPSMGTFQQRFTLLHRGTDRPMVLHTTGYNAPIQVFRAEPTRLVDGNQISVEQRFFTPSRPAPPDWSRLTIWQAATDHHRLIQALKPIYAAKWLSTGASKGGMTSVYHRRFYPSDVDGTVAYVAPQDSVNDRDTAYDRFFATVGTDPACRVALDRIQTEALKRRTKLVALYRAWAKQNKQTFTIVRGVDRAFEFMVNGSTWAFWQYGNQSQCSSVPRRSASNNTLLSWLDAIYGLLSNTDQGIEGFVPYYHQAATQLGYPFLKLRHLAELQRYPGQDVARSYVPRDIPTTFRPFAMLDVDVWVKRSGRQLLFVYGQNDPWGAEPFRLGRGTIDSYSYTAAGANHGANISLLTPAENATATAAVQRWAGVAAPGGSAAKSAAAPWVAALDAWNPALQRRPVP
jgi:hypothetical protein